MSKKNRQPKEPKPYIDTCNHCNTETPVSGETAYGVESTRVPFGQFVVNTCVECGGETKLFTDADNLAAFKTRGIEVHQTEEIPGPDFLERYLDLMGIPLPESKELTPDEEDYVATRGLYLQTIDVTAEDFERTT